MLTPPLVTMASLVAAASRSTASSAASSSRHDRPTIDDAAGLGEQRGEHRRLLSRIWPGRSGEPSVTSSSPVDSTATRGRGNAGTRRALTLASTPRRPA